MNEENLDEINRKGREKVGEEEEEENSSLARNRCHSAPHGYGYGCGSGEESEEEEEKELDDEQIKRPYMDELHQEDREEEDEEEEVYKEESGPPCKERKEIEAKIVSVLSKSGKAMEWYNWMKKDMEDYEKKIEELRQEMEEKDGIISRHRSSQIKWAQTAEERDEELRIMNKEKRENERAIGKLRKEMADLKDTLKTERMSNEDFVHQQEEKQDEYKAKVTELSSRLREAEEKEALTRKERDDLAEIISSLKEENKQLKDRNEKAKTEYISNKNEQRKHTEEIKEELRRDRRGNNGEKELSAKVVKDPRELKREAMGRKTEIKQKRNRDPEEILVLRGELTESENERKEDSSNNSNNINKSNSSSNNDNDNSSNNDKSSNNNSSGSSNRNNNIGRSRGSSKSNNSSNNNNNNFDGISNDFRNLEERLKIIEAQMSFMQPNAAHQHTSQLPDEFQQRQRKRNNIIIFGLPENKQGDDQQHDRHQLNALLDNLGVSINPNDVSFFRVGNGNSNGNRPLVAKLGCHQMKADILSKAKTLRNDKNWKGVAITHDLTKLQCQEEKVLEMTLKTEADRRNGALPKNQKTNKIWRGVGGRGTRRLMLKDI